MRVIYHHFGYDKVKLKNQKGYSLKINDNEAFIVREIFRLYSLESSTICSVTRIINEMCLKPRIADEWRVSSVKDILTNPTYIGKIVWNRRKEKKRTKNGRIIKSRPRNHDYLIYDGLHESIIDNKTWEIVQEKRKQNVPKVVHGNQVQNPLVRYFKFKIHLCGIVFCEKCGKPMQRRPYNKKNVPATLICLNPKCNNISSKLFIVEEKLIEALKLWLSNYKLNYEVKDFEKNDNDYLLKQSVTNIQKEIEKENKKLNKLYDFLETGIYSGEEFIKRSSTIKENINKLQEKLNEYNGIICDNKNVQEEKSFIIPKFENVIDLYYKLESAEDKNILLKSILYKVTYLKTEKAIKKDSDPTNFELNIFPKIPKI